MLTKNYRFDPTDQELIEFLYLKIKESKTGKAALHPAVMESLVKERDVYSREPWNLQYYDDEFLLRMKETEMYFFCRRTPSSSDTTLKCVNAKRTVGDVGKWHGNGKKIPVTAPTRSGREAIIGHKTFLSFAKKDNTKCHWVMDEYSLHRKNKEFQHTVLCRIREIKRQEEQQENVVSASATEEQPCSNKRSHSEAPSSSRSSSQQQQEDIAAMEEQSSSKRSCMEATPMVPISWSLPQEEQPLAIAVYQHPDQIDRRFDGQPQAAAPPMSSVPFQQQHPSPIACYLPPDQIDQLCAQPEAAAFPPVLPLPLQQQCPSPIAYQPPGQIDQFFAQPQAPTSSVPLQQQHPSHMASYRSPHQIEPYYRPPQAAAPPMSPWPPQQQHNLQQQTSTASGSVQPDRIGSYPPPRFPKQRQHQRQQRQPSSSASWCPSHIIHQLAGEYNRCMSNPSAFSTYELAAHRGSSTQLPAHVIHERIRQLAEATTPQQ